MGVLIIRIGFGGYFCTIVIRSTHRPLSSSFLGLPYRILNINHIKELLRSLWVFIKAPMLRVWDQCMVLGSGIGPQIWATGNVTGLNQGLDSRSRLSVTGRGFGFVEGFVHLQS